MAFLRWLWELNPPWILDQFLSIVIGGAVGGLAGLVVGYYTQLFSEPPPITITVIPNELGQAQPMSDVVEAINQDESPISLAFEPENVRDVVVCEFAYVTGKTGKEAALAYFSKYSMCFYLAERVSNQTWAVRPNRRSGEMNEKDGNWACLCG